MKRQRLFFTSAPAAPFMACAAAALFSLASLLASCGNGGSAAAPRLEAFSLSGTVGSINQSTGVVTVRLSSAITDYSSLGAAYTLSSGASLSTSVPTDYSTSPVPLVIVNGEGEQKVYLIDVGPSLAEAAADALLISEYYCGSGYDYDDTLNRWIELTNRSSSSIDLAQYSLVKRDWESGSRASSRDVAVSLRGTLAAGASLVVYSSRLATSTFTSVVAVASPDLLYSDDAFNTILDSDGDDGYQLVRDGLVLDALGPDGGAGDGALWSKEKRLLRKNTEIPSETWNASGWVVYGILGTNSDAANTGSPTSDISSSDTTLTWFALEDLDVSGTIDTAAKTVSLSAVENTDVSSAVVGFGTVGSGIEANAQALVSGTSRLDLTAPVTVRVWGNDGTSYSDYTVSVTFYHKLAFVTANYDFSGNINAAYTAVKNGGTSTTTLGTALTGIVTAKDIYVTSTYKKSFFVQDRDKGMLVLSSTSITPSMGAKVTFTALSGTTYYSMPEIKSFSGLALVDTAVHDIYYKTGDYNSLDCVGDVYMWEGAIDSAMDSYSVGSFEGDLYFHSDKYTSALAAALAQGKRGTFHGPVSYSYSQYRMEISSLDQVVLK